MARERGEDGTLLSRRSYLEMASTAAVTVSSAGLVSDSASADEYEVRTSSSKSDGDMSPVEVSLRRTSHLAEKDDASAEDQGARYVERAFDRLGVPYKLVWGLPPVSACPTTDVGKSKQLQKWTDRVKNRDEPKIMKDANILLTDRESGGSSYPTTKAGVAPGAVYDDYPITDWVTPDDDRHPFFGMLHELAHQLSVPTDGHTKTWGRTWYDEDSETWNRTPMGNAGSGKLCGRENPPNEKGWPQRDHLYFAECARNHLIVS
jgi:hypothetical protein